MARLGKGGVAKNSSGRPNGGEEPMGGGGDGIRHGREAWALALILDVLREDVIMVVALC